jgi:hypothetical protein
LFDRLGGRRGRSIWLVRCGAAQIKSDSVVFSSPSPFQLATRRVRHSIWHALCEVTEAITNDYRVFGAEHEISEG